MKKNKLTLETLAKDFPDLYKEAHPECSEGWTALLYDLSKKITKELEKMPEKGEEKFWVAQVKSKFGGLRYYVYNSNEAIDKLITEAESLSYKTCEDCGKPGEEVGRGWIYTLCPPCAEKTFKNADK